MLRTWNLSFYLHKHNLFTQAQLSFYFNKQHNLRPENCLKGHSMHNALSPKGFGKLINEYLRPHFLLSRLFHWNSDRNIWVKIFCQFHYLSNIWYELKPHLSSTIIFTRISWNFDRLAEGCDKVRGPVEQNLGKNGSKYFRISRWEKNIWEIFVQRTAGRIKIRIKIEQKLGLYF